MKGVDSWYDPHIIRILESMEKFGYRDHLKSLTHEIKRLRKMNAKKKTIGK